MLIFWKVTKTAMGGILFAVSEISKTDEGSVIRVLTKKSKTSTALMWKERRFELHFG